MKRWLKSTSHLQKLRVHGRRRRVREDTKRPLKKSEGVPSFRGSDWRDCADNNSWLGASPVTALLERGNDKATHTQSRRLWSQLEEASMVWWKQLFGHQTKQHISSPAWSMVVTASCCEGAPLPEALEGFWGKRVKWMQLNTEKSWRKTDAVCKQHVTWEKIFFPQ